MEKLFFDNGLNFSCQQCSYCCRFEGGVVRLSKDDLTNLAQWANLSEENFIKVYCRYIENDKGEVFLILKVLKDGTCIFWDKELCNGKGGCQAYEARPIQCSTFPFWTNILKDEKSWESAAETCPGINIGSHHTKEEILENLNKYNNRIPIKKSE